MYSIGNSQLVPFGRNDYCVSSTFDFRTGDFVTARVKSLPILLHRGIIVVEDNCVSVYHNTPMYKNFSGGSVVKENIEEWLKSRDITSIEPTDMTQEYIEEKSMQLAHRPFNLLKFNCEQYAFLLKDGYAKSPQLFWWGVGIFSVGLYKLLKD